MKHPFTTLTLQDVQKLRRMPMAVLATPVPYNFSKADIDAAVLHLETIYKGRVTSTFAAKILLNNEIY